MSGLTGSQDQGRAVTVVHESGAGEYHDVTSNRRTRPVIRDAGTYPGHPWPYNPDCTDAGRANVMRF